MWSTFRFCKNRTCSSNCKNLAQVLNLKFATQCAAWACELRVRGLVWPRGLQHVHLQFSLPIATADLDLAALERRLRQLVDHEPNEARLPCRVHEPEDVTRFPILGLEL